MRVFYLFELKDKVLKNYKNNYEELYNLLESVHYLKTEDIVLGYSIFNSLVYKIDKEFYNNQIKHTNISNECYICYNYTHTINDYYNDESTKMIINNSYIRIKTNKNIPSFFYDLRKYRNIFVCDFNNHDYFLLEQTVYTSCV